MDGLIYLHSRLRNSRTNKIQRRVPKAMADRKGDRDKKDIDEDDFTTNFVDLYLPKIPFR